METYFQQAAFDVKFEWGLHGLQALLHVSDVVIIVDVLSFSTCVDIATAKGALVYPYQWKDETAVEYAKSIDAVLAGFERTGNAGYTLSPASLANIPPNTKLVLPSPNGSAISLATGNTTTICGCLRNANAVAAFASEGGKRISVIAAGERWPDGTLRPALEDMIGAGAIIAVLKGTLSPESLVALSAFSSVGQKFTEAIKQCASGKELIARGFEEDVELACMLNVSDNVPLLHEGAYVGK